MASKIYPSVKPADGTSRLQANASSKQIRGAIKPLTKGLRDYDKSGGGRNPAVPTERWIKALKDAIG